MYWVYSINWKSLTIQVIKIENTLLEARQTIKQLVEENEHTAGERIADGIDRAHPMKTFGCCAPTKLMEIAFEDRIASTTRGLVATEVPAPAEPVKAKAQFETKEIELADNLTLRVMVAKGKSKAIKAIRNREALELRSMEMNNAFDR